MLLSHLLDWLQFDGSLKFRITLPRQGYITVSSQLDYEAMKEAGRTYYLLNVSATVCATFITLFSTFVQLKFICHASSLHYTHIYIS